MLQAKLIVVGGEVKTKEVNLKLPAVIGRGREATLTLPHALVSRTHCEIFEREGRLVVRDLGSLNGTYVNNYRIANEQPVLPGELITIGTVTFRADYILDAVTCGEAGAELIAERHAAASVVSNRTTGPSLRVDDPRELTRPATDLPAEIAAANLAGRFDTTVAGRLPGKPRVPLRPAPVVANESSAAPTPPEGIEFLHSGNERRVAGESIAPRSASAAEPSSAESSDIFSGLEFAPSPQKSISISALEHLPGQAKPAVSFVGPIGGEPLHEFIETDPPIQVDPQETESSQPVDENDSQLGSFIRKLPR